MKIIPRPKSVEMKDGFLSLDKIEVIKLLNTERRVNKISIKLKSEIDNLIKGNVKFTTVGENYICDCCGIFITHGSGDNEEYSVVIDKNGVSLIGNGAKGAFYAVQTLRQIIHEYGKNLPFVVIKDKPDFLERGFYHDITRGKVPTLKQLYKITDMLAYYKINGLQLYVENSFAFKELEGVVGEEEVLTAEEITALDDYCYDNYIELVPSIATFGHLYNLLQSKKYSHLCEFENWQPKKLYWIEKMEHHTIDVSNSESIDVIKSMIDQYIPLFRSDKFNICCDETFDLCKGKNSGLDEGEEYYKFVKKITDHVKSRGKKIMMWGDIALKYPDKLSCIPDDTVMLNWTYVVDPDESKVKTIADTGLSQIVCPGTSTWNRFIEDIERSTGNITRLAEYGKKYGAKGLLNTNWGDYGNICAFNCELYGIVLGAECGWNPGMKTDVEFEKAVSALVYDSKDLNIVEIIRKIGQCEKTCFWQTLVRWVSENTFENKKTELECDTDKTVKNIAELDKISQQIKSLGNENKIYTDLYIACRAVKSMNMFCLAVNGVPGFDDKNALVNDIEDWLGAYADSWMSENKSSRLGDIVAFIKKLPDIAFNL